MHKYFIMFLVSLAVNIFGAGQSSAQSKVLWSIGADEHSPQGFALAPGGYKKYLENDFGYEDRYFLAGYSRPEHAFPYVLPGPADSWGGSGGSSGIRSQVQTILFGLNKLPATGTWKFIVNVAGNQADKPPLLKISINGKVWKFQLPAGLGDTLIGGGPTKGKGLKFEIPFQSSLLRTGGNEITMVSLEGSWLVFGQLRLEGPESAEIEKPENVFIRNIKPAGYETEMGPSRFQPLLIDLEHLKGRPRLQVLLDRKQVFNELIDTARYQFEVPMPAVSHVTLSTYEVLSNGKRIRSGKVMRSPQALNTPADYVDTKLGSAHSRWMIAPGPWMPFSMVKLSPDNQNSGWQSGYDPSFESIGVFSHIHEWTMAGLGMLPVNGPLKIRVGDQQIHGNGYRSAIDKTTEESPLGYYKVELMDYRIKAELTATTRCSFQRYTYPSGSPDSRIMIDLQIPSEYAYKLEEVHFKKVNDHKIEGYSRQHAADVWSGGMNQDYTIHFAIEFDQPIKKFGTWANDKLSAADSVTAKGPDFAGAFVEFDTRKNRVVQTRTGISLVSMENANLNLEKEVVQPYGWNFKKVREGQKETWNKLLDRLVITSNDRREKLRFYSNMYRALCSRNTWSDVDGRWVDATEKVQQLKDPKALALGCDAFWNTFWNLNQFWNLVTPEWSSRWVKSELAMYTANGWLARGPAGMEYIPVMVAEHEIPLMVSAWQMGIRDYDGPQAFQAMKKMQTSPAQNVGDGRAGNDDLLPYLKYHYIPYDLGRFSNTMEYAYDDWTVSQMAHSLGKETEYHDFLVRSGWWKNAIDSTTGYARMRKSDGSWFPDFDPFRSGANQQYVEGNAWQLTFFVPQNVPGLIKKIGAKRFTDRLEWGFKASEKWRFNGPNDQYWDYPVDQGNQQSMHFPFLFNWAKKPWLTQQWSRSVLDRYYGYGVGNAYLGDEDQGQMSAWYMMAALGLFQTDGGCRVNPVYEIASPLFPEVTIHLGQQYGRGKEFRILANHVSRTNKYIQHAMLNGKELDTFWFPAAELLKGGSLVLDMGPAPMKSWGISANPPVLE